MKCLGLHYKPKAEVHPGHMPTGPKEEEKEECKAITNLGCFRILLPSSEHLGVLAS
jgi:hypothetical protein